MDATDAGPNRVPVEIPDARALLKQYGLQPRRSLGQNFLVDPTASDRIADCADLTAAHTVVEVGAGLGTLTAALASRARKVIAVETDPSLVDVLTKELGHAERVQIVQGDILDLDPAELLGRGAADVPPDAAASRPLWGARARDYCVVANLPYYITNAVVRHLLEATVRPDHLVLTVQLEVARRMVAQPNDMSLLAVSVQFYGKPKLCLRLKPGAFHPVPSVSSAVVRIDTHDQPPAHVDDIGVFFRVVRAGFSQRRKQLRNALSGSLALDPSDVAGALAKAGVDRRRRAETLSVPEWGAVTVALTPHLV